MDLEKSLENYLTKEEIQSLLKEINKSPTHAFIFNPRKTSKETLKSKFKNIEEIKFNDLGFSYLKEEYDLGKSIYHELGAIYITEPSASLVAGLLEINDGELILDMCAAPGGKTAALSLKNPNGVILSNDLSFQRCKELVSNVERMGLSNVMVTNNDFSKIYKYYHNYFDKIVLDAPCSSSGMIRKDIKMLKDWSYNKVLKCAKIQKELILYAYYMLKPGGILSYSTCSFSKEENEDVVNYLLSNSDAKIVNLPNDDKFYKGVDGVGIHLFPFKYNGEGHYICQIKKEGELSQFKNSNKKSEICYNGFIYTLPYRINDRYLNIVRYGLKVGERINDFIRYDHHFASCCTSFDKIIELNEEQTGKYLLGECLKSDDSYIGNVLLTYENIPIAIAKKDETTIKNSYPKGLRKKVKFYPTLPN